MERMYYYTRYIFMKLKWWVIHCNLFCKCICMMLHSLGTQHNCTSSNFLLQCQTSLMLYIPKLIDFFVMRSTMTLQLHSKITLLYPYDQVFCVDNSKAWNSHSRAEFVVWIVCLPCSLKLTLHRHFF